MFNFNRFRKTLAPETHYARNGSGILLPILAGLAYRYREPILRFVRGKLDEVKAARQQWSGSAGSTMTGTPPPIPTSQPF
jgi:hypothetical protein